MDDCVTKKNILENSGNILLEMTSEYHNLPSPGVLMQEISRACGFDEPEDWSLYSAVSPEEEEENLKYVDYLEYLKNVIFPGGLHHYNFSANARSRIVEAEEQLFHLRKQRNELLRKENELIYTLHDILLQEENERLRKEVLPLSEIPDYCKTPEQSMRESQLLHHIIQNVSHRDTMLVDLHVEKLREIEEDEKIEEDYRIQKAEWDKLVTADSGSTSGSQKENHSCSKFNNMKTKFRRIMKKCIIL
ncbi:uncharacterized protein LOC111087447 [Limulus polyphemus]|uniref:Uncharacterized protein LOC111087447 n=1 Tax=Limulus polyphemus TaxID=6850 RepID=A0ABM1T1N7_LIMPO|nr:uncharacterized protein LOC111087447 [Limulus polyphemus]